MIIAGSETLWAILVMVLSALGQPSGYHADFYPACGRAELIYILDCSAPSDRTSGDCLYISIRVEHEEGSTPCEL